MKTIKQIREEYDRISLDQVHIAPDELMLEGRESAVKSAGKSVPSPANMPAMLLFRRVQYRSFPGKQTVALYYSKMVNKYLSIPFGPEGNLNLSEAVVLDSLDEGALKTIAKTVGGALTGGLSGAAKGAAFGRIAGEPGFALGAAIGGTVGAVKGAKKAYNKAKENNMEEDWQDVNRKDKTDGLSQKAVNAYRREHPGSKLKTAVTEKNPSGKRASRRKSFCSRMGGMKKRLTSAKTARDPDSNINKALRRWNCEESFRDKLNVLREEKVKPWMDYSDLGGAVKTATELTPGASAYQKYKQGDKAGAAKSAAIDVALGGVAAKGLQLARKGVKAARSFMKTRKGAAAAGAAGAAVGAAASKPDNKKDDSIGSAFTPHKAELLSAKREPQMSSSYKMGKGTDQTFDSRYKQSLIARPSQTNENKISDIRNMLNEGIDTMDLSINGRTITLNNSMAKKIVRVYESVNTKNKKIVESMLNEDLDSFKKLLNFSIKA